VNPVTSDSHFSVVHGGSATLASGTLLPVGPCDDCGSYVPLPFSFPFYGTSYSSACLTSNGYIQFGMCIGAYSDCVSCMDAYRGIAVAWDDLYISCAGEGWFRSSGPDFVRFRFSGHHYGGGSCSSINFQATLFSDGSVRLDYGTWNAPMSATVGVGRGAGPSLWALSNENMHLRPSVSFYTADAAPPVTTATLSGPEGAAGWYVGDVVVTLEATDNRGVAGTEIDVDGAGFTPYTGPVTVTGDGQHVVTFRSTDINGNVEAPVSATFGIDATPPETTITSPEPGFVYAQGMQLAPSPVGTVIATGSVTFTAEASDAASGVAAITWFVDDEPVAVGETFVFDADARGTGTYVVSVHAADVAGNLGARASMTVEVVASPPLPPL